MHAGAGGFSHRVKILQFRGGMHIDLHTAAHEMRRGHHRNPLLGHVDSEIEASDEISSESGGASRNA